MSWSSRNSKRCVLFEVYCDMGIYPSPKTCGPIASGSSGGLNWSLALRSPRYIGTSCWDCCVCMSSSVSQNILLRVVSFSMELSTLEAI